LYVDFAFSFLVCSILQKKRQKTLEEEKGKEMEAATRLVFENLQSVVAAKFAK
jgi:hypothetical protein